MFSSFFPLVSNEGSVLPYKLQIIRSNIVEAYECRQLFPSFDSDLLICIGDDDYYNSVCSVKILHFPKIYHFTLLIDATK